MRCRCRSWATAVGVVLVLLLAAPGCGGSRPAPPPAPVDVALAPASVLDGAIGLYRNADPGTARAFADAGDRSLMADGALWELRRAERLVGTLQVTRVLPKVDLRRAQTRAAIVRDVLGGSGTTIRVRDVEVATVTSGEKVASVWFGADVVEILVYKPIDDLAAEQVLTAVIAHQAGVAAWEPLPPEVLQEEG